MVKEDAAQGAIFWHHDEAGKSSSHFVKKGNSSGRYNGMMKETCDGLPSPKGKILGSFLCKATCPVLRGNGGHFCMKTGCMLYSSVRMKYETKVGRAVVKKVELSKKISKMLAHGMK